MVCGIYVTKSAGELVTKIEKKSHYFFCDLIFFTNVKIYVLIQFKRKNNIY